MNTSITRLARLAFGCALILAFQFPPANAGSLPSPPNAPQFLVPPIIPTSAKPSQVATGDFNGDGKVDLAVTNSSGVDVLLGKGDGTYQAAVTYKTHSGGATYAIVLADMNNDGIPDLVVTTSSAAGEMQIALGKGDGTFAAFRGFGGGGDGISIAVGDFNGDGKLDVVAGNANKSVTVWLGNGDGTLQTYFNYATSGEGYPYGVAVADINGDGKDDIVAGVNSVDVFYGNGNGTFKPATVIVAGASARQLSVGDINSDGFPDIIFDNGKGFGVLLNQGGGNFGGYIETLTQGLSGPFVLGDFNGDGRIDVAVASLGIFLGQGTGHFKAPAAYYDTYNGGWLAAADVNSDGKLDVVQVAAAASGVALYFGNGNGTVQGPQEFQTSGDVTPRLLAAGDFNGDGNQDVVSVGASNNVLAGDVLLGTGKGTFATAFGFAPIGNQAILVGDFNNDKKLDFALLDYTANKTGQVGVYLGNGDGTFQTALTTDAGFDAVAFAAGDFNHDGNLDLAVVNTCINSVNCLNGTVTILNGNGDGSFTTGAVVGVGNNPNSIAAGDFNNDGIPDLAVADGGNGKPNSSQVVFLAGIGNGTFQPPAVVNEGVAESDLIAADFNGDGNLDLAVINSGVSVSVALGRGNGTFRAPVTTTPQNLTAPMVAADFNGDGKLDLAFSGNVQVLLGTGNGGFSVPLFPLPDLYSPVVLPVLLGNDKFPDLVLGAPNGQVAVVTNQTR